MVVRGAGVELHYSSVVAEAESVVWVQQHLRVKEVVAVEYLCQILQKKMTVTMVGLLLEDLEKTSRSVAHLVEVVEGERVAQPKSWSFELLVAE